jgi:hypothetical protein
MISQSNVGREPTTNEIAFEVISEIARAGSIPPIRQALKPLAQFLCALRHHAADECNTETVKRARGALVELGLLLEAKPAEPPKPKQRFRVFTGDASRVV